MGGLMVAALGLTLFAANPHGNLVDETAYAQVLATHVVDARVDYAALKKDRSAIDGYLKAVGAVSRADYDAASKEAKVAYLTNAYNAYTLDSIVESYPIKGGFFGGANSIKGIPGVWNKRTHATALGKVTLDEIEHANLRKMDVPGVHMALVCASKGCPPLRTEPYWADGLAAQLDEQAASYLGSKWGLVVGGGTVKLSAIFKWFGEDFAMAGGWKAWVVAHAPEAKRAAVKKALESDTFEWLSYDWSLNDRKGS